MPAPEASAESEAAFGVAVDAAGNAYLTGGTASPTFPLAGPIQVAYGGGMLDAFVAKLTPAGSSFVYSTILGGEDDVELALLVDDVPLADRAGDDFHRCFS